MNYYNEIDKKVAAWLRELIKRDLIAPGEVDERSIEDVVPSDLKGFTQCHFFAGIGGWSYALRLAGWHDDKPVWTGSCPCQPFSTAGKGAGFADERHLWPAWFHLIKQCGPAAIFGEQVASKNTNPWFDLVQADLEGMGYAFGCIAFPSAGVGAPHIRDRAYWVANAESQRDMRRPVPFSSAIERPLRTNLHQPEQSGGLFDRLANPDLPDAKRFKPFSISLESQQETERCGALHPWAKSEFIGCADGKARPIEPGTSPLAYGIPERLVRLRGYGNAINPYAAKAFIEATQEALSDLESLQTAVAA